MRKLWFGVLNIYEAEGSANGRDGHGKEIGGDRLSALMDNDSPKSQIKTWTTASIMLNPPWGFCQ